MKAIAKVLLVGGAAVMAIAASVVPSEAAKKSKKASACTPMMTCATACKGANCNQMACGLYGKLYPAIPPVCIKPFCPSACWGWSVCSAWFCGLSPVRWEGSGFFGPPPRAAV